MLYNRPQVRSLFPVPPARFFDPLIAEASLIDRLRARRSLPPFLLMSRNGTKQTEDPRFGGAQEAQLVIQVHACERLLIEFLRCLSPLLKLKSLLLHFQTMPPSAFYLRRSRAGLTELRFSSSIFFFCCHSSHNELVISPEVSNLLTMTSIPRKKGSS